MSTFQDQLKQIKIVLEEQNKNKIKQAVPKLNINSNTLKIKDGTIEKNLKKELLQKAKPVVFHFHDNLKSVRVKEHHFTNMLRSKEGTHYHDILTDIFSIDGKELIDDKDIPFTLEQEELIISKKHVDIMNASNVYGGQTKIHKSTYRDMKSRMLNTNPKESSVRMFYLKDKESRKILLIDLYHLFAYSKADKDYPKYSSYDYCMGNMECRKKSN